MGTLGIGVIGCGRRMHVLLEHLRLSGGGARVVALCDPQPAAIDRFQRSFAPDARAYRDHVELVRDPDVDWVLIGSVNSCHAEHATAALAAGKHVFCEKPLATTFDDCLRMRDAWRASGRRFLIGFVLRYSEHYRRIKSLLDRGAIGRPISVEFNETLHPFHGAYLHATWRRHAAATGGFLLEKCCHDIDLASWLVGSIARRVSSFGGNDVFTPANAALGDRIGPGPSGERPYQCYSGGHGSPFVSDKDIVDNQVAIIEYANRVRATFHTNANGGIPERRMAICGTEGALRSDLFAGRIETRRIGFDTPIEDHSVGATDGHGGADALIVRELLAAMRDGKAPETTLEDGLISAITCFGIDEAMRAGRVVDLEPMWRRAGIAMGGMAAAR